MFGGNMMKKLQEMQQKVAETKARLNTITVTGESGNGKVNIVVNGNRVVKSVTINDDLNAFSQSNTIHIYLTLRKPYYLIWLQDFL